MLNTPPICASMDHISDTKPLIPDILSQSHSCHPSISWLRDVARLYLWSGFIRIDLMNASDQSWWRSTKLFTRLCQESALCLLKYKAFHSLMPRISPLSVEVQSFPIAYAKNQSSVCCSTKLSTRLWQESAHCLVKYKACHSHMPKTSHLSGEVQSLPLVYAKNHPSVWWNTKLFTHLCQESALCFGEVQSLPLAYAENQPSVWWNTKLATRLCQ